MGQWARRRRLTPSFCFVEQIHKNEDMRGEQDSGEDRIQH